MELTPVEAELAAAVEAGEGLDLSRRADRVVRAKVIRDLVRRADADPLGVQVFGARIVGLLDLDMVQAAVPLLLDNCFFEERPTMFGAEIPALSLDGSTLPGLCAEGLRTRHFTMVSARVTGTVDLDYARVEGRLDLGGSSLRTGDAVALRGVGLHVGRVVWLTDLLAESTTDIGTVRLNNCDIGGDLILARAVVTNACGNAVHLDNASIAGSVRLERAFVRTADAGDAMRMIDAKIGGQFDLHGAVLRADSGQALCADGVDISASMFLTGGFDAASASRDSTISLIGARIDDLSVRDATIRGRLGRAVLMNKAEIKTSIQLQDAELEGRTGEAALDITDTDLGSQLGFINTKIINHGQGLDLDLFQTRIGRSFLLPVGTLTERADFTVSVNGLSYPEPPLGRGDWLGLLSRHVPGYEAQPYQQLAKVHRAVGHEQLARKILIAQQDDLRRRGDPGNRLWHWFLGKTLGYGYQPSRAVAGLIATFILAIALVFLASQNNGTTPAKDRPANACNVINRIGLAADLSIPLVKLGGSPRCEFSDTTAGQWFTAGGWVIQILGWSFATLSVAGFTGLVRKT